MLYIRYLFFRKSCRFLDNVAKYCTVGEVTDNNITQRKRIACWITKAIDTNSKPSIIITF